jgi:hypothetical protein
MRHLNDFCWNTALNIAQRQGDNAIPCIAERVNNHHYLKVTRPMTWKDAHTFCEDLGGHLVSVNTVAEENWIKASSGTRSAYYTGCMISRNGTARWMTGEPWKRKEKINVTSKKSQAPGVMRFTGPGSFDWYQKEEWSTHFFIVEWDR